MATKEQLTQINEALEWIARTNRTLANVQHDQLQTMQYTRLRQQFIDQLTTLLTGTTQLLKVIPKSTRKAA
ncbi:hypothetical protein J2I47_00215 [Fibrella sp. HMF5335]|uniref:Uncharacterized protein n=1 Tax=Fibrella rubiginis TaxID=2817060 RepID=A0A939JZD7_9BACT|nr:hypothetical protein [Fibrella rubiginis]MBO0934957.1 hypothetical protein [Fibrella rubiginis]